MDILIQLGLVPFVMLVVAIAFKPGDFLEAIFGLFIREEKPDIKSGHTGSAEEEYRKHKLVGFYNIAMRERT